MFNFFGNKSFDPMAMIGPMLPGMMKKAGPAITKAFIDKAEALEWQTDFAIVNKDDLRTEIVPFVLLRAGELQINWVVLQHELLDEENDDWETTIVDSIETVTLSEFLAAAMQQLAPPTDTPPPPQQLQGVVKGLPPQPRQIQVEDGLFVVFRENGRLQKVRNSFYEPMVEHTFCYGPAPENECNEWIVNNAASFR